MTDALQKKRDQKHQGAFSGLHSLMITLILLPFHGYRLLISPLLGANCRFAPSCSAYAIEAIQLHGIIKGGYLTAKRLGKCHPWGGSGVDPVPKKATPEDER